MTTITLDPTLDPWERQPGETPKKHGQFLTYRDLGLARTLTKAAEVLTLAYSSVRVTSSRYRWPERAAAWDAHQSRQYAAEMEEARRQAAKDDARILRFMTGMIGQALPAMQPDRMTWADFTRLVETTMRWKRNLFGDPTDTIAVTGPGGDPLTVAVEEFTALTPEQRRDRMEALAATVTRRLRAINGGNDEDDEDDGEEQYGREEEDAEAVDSP